MSFKIHNSSWNSTEVTYKYLEMQPQSQSKSWSAWKFVLKSCQSNFINQIDSLRVTSFLEILLC